LWEGGPRRAGNKRRHKVNAGRKKRGTDNSIRGLKTITLSLGKKKRLRSHSTESGGKKKKTGELLGWGGGKWGGGGLGLW